MNEEGRNFAGLITACGTINKAASARREMKTTVTRRRVSIANPRGQKLQGLCQVPKNWSFLKRPQVKEKLFREREKSTPTGCCADDTITMGPNFQTPDSMVDHRSVFVKLNIFDKTIETVCGSGAKLSCLSSDIFHKLRKLGQKKFLATETELVAVNKLAVTCKRTVRLPIIHVLKHYENELHVPINSEPDCFLGLTFLRTHMSDLWFSNDWLHLDSKNHVPLYHRKHNHQLNTVFRVKATETVSVPAGHAKIWPAWIQEGKWPLTEIPAPFEPVVLISTLKKAVVPNVLFNFAENVPFTFEKLGDEVFMVYENTTLGSSEFFLSQALKHIDCEPPKSTTNEIDEFYDLKHVIDLVSPAVPLKERQKFAELVQKFTDVFSKNQWYIGKCDVTSLKIVFTRVQSSQNTESQTAFTLQARSEKNHWRVFCRRAHVAMS